MSAEARAAVVDPRNRSQRWSARGVEDVLARRGRDAGCSPPPARRATPTAGPAVRAFATGPTAGARRGIDNGNQVFNKSRRSVRIARRLAGGKGSGNEGGARAASRRRLPWTAVREATEGASKGYMPLARAARTATRPDALKLASATCCVKRGVYFFSASVPFSSTSITRCISFNFSILRTLLFIYGRTQAVLCSV